MSETPPPPRNPMQPMILADDGAVRFRQNAIVRKLLEMAARAGYTLNNVAGDVTFTQDDYEQLMQLIGYSLKGFHELSCVSDETAFEATRIATEQFGSVAADQGCRAGGCGWHLGVPRTTLAVDARPEERID